METNKIKCLLWTLIKWLVAKVQSNIYLLSRSNLSILRILWPRFINIHVVLSMWLISKENKMHMRMCSLGLCLKDRMANSNTYKLTNLMISWWLVLRPKILKIINLIKTTYSCLLQLIVHQLKNKTWEINHLQVRSSFQWLQTKF